MSALAVTVVVAAGDAAGAVLVGAALRLVEVGSDFAQLMSNRLDTTTKAISSDFDI